MDLLDHCKKVSDIVDATEKIAGNKLESVVEGSVIHIYCRVDGQLPRKEMNNGKIWKIDFPSKPPS